MDDSRIKRACSILDAFFDIGALRSGSHFIDVRGSWGSIAGERLGLHSRPVDIKKSVLIIEVDHSSWLQLLQLRQEAILVSIRRTYPELDIRSLAFKLAGAPETPCEYTL